MEESHLGLDFVTNTSKSNVNPVNDLRLSGAFAPGFSGCVWVRQTVIRAVSSISKRNSQLLQVRRIVWRVRGLSIVPPSSCSAHGVARNHRETLFCDRRTRRHQIAIRQKQMEASACRNGMKRLARVTHRPPWSTAMASPISWSVPHGTSPGSSHPVACQSR